MKRIPRSEVLKQEAGAILEGYLEEGPAIETLAYYPEACHMLQVALEGGRLSGPGPLPAWVLPAGRLA